MDPVSVIPITYQHDDFMFRFRGRLLLRDLDDCMLMPVINCSLAKKIKTIHIFANGYKLDEIGQAEFSIDDTEFKVDLPINFTEQELMDPWVRIRPSTMSSVFHFRFFERTPRRLFISEEAKNTLTARRKRDS
jgi:hypothetical protein